LHGVAPFSDVCLETNILLKGAAPSSFGCGFAALCSSAFIRGQIAFSPAT